jgi:hypothetical protein
MPGNEDVIGDTPMCLDALGMHWFKDLLEGNPKPTNAAPGLCYMLCGATQHSNTDAHDKTSPAIPIGPHWMILWPFDASHCGLPTTVRDAGAWIMFAGTPYAYLHVCGTPWAALHVCGTPWAAPNICRATKRSGRCAIGKRPPVRRHRRVDASMEASMLGQ